MEKTNHDEIRQEVRESYGKVAKAGAAPFEVKPATSCCGESDISSGTSTATSCCSMPGYTLEEISTLMGYSKEDRDSVPEGANLGLGCGNPVALATLKPGETVVDLGSGGGFDSFLAAKKVGETKTILNREV